MEESGMTIGRDKENENLSTLSAGCILNELILCKLAKLMTWDTICSLCKTSRYVWNALSPLLFGNAIYAVTDQTLEEEKFCMCRTENIYGNSYCNFAGDQVSIMYHLITRLELSGIQDFAAVAEIIEACSDKLQELYISTSKPVVKGDLEILWKSLARKNVKVLMLDLHRECYKNVQICTQVPSITTLQMNFIACDKRFFSQIIQHLPKLTEIKTTNSDDAYVLKLHFYYLFGNYYLKPDPDATYTYHICKFDEKTMGEQAGWILNWRSQLTPNRYMYLLKRAQQVKFGY